MDTPSKYESAKLILKLYDLRREETIRKARDWFIWFIPSNVDEITATLMGEHSAYFRMVISYWEMAAALVNHGAIDEEMFNDAIGSEFVGVFSKLAPFLAETREKYNAPTYLQHLESLVMRMPGAAERLVTAREQMKQFAEARAKQAGAEAASSQS